MNANFDRKITIEDFLPKDQLELKNFTCPICGFIILNAVIDRNAHVFCKECVLTYLSSKPSAPCPSNTGCIITNDSIKSITLISNFLMIKEIKCLNQIKGCSWIGLFSLLPNHLSAQCLKQSIPCVYQSNGCNESLLREQSTIHLADCPYRPIQCRNNCNDANQVIIFKDELKHLAICPNEVIDCPNLCGARFERKGLDRHSDECDKEFIPCAYEVYGCNAQVLKKERHKHMTECLHQHNSLIIDYVERTKEDMKMISAMKLELENELKEKVEMCRKLMGKIITYEKEAKMAEEQIILCEDKDDDNSDHENNERFLRKKKEREFIGKENNEEGDDDKEDNEDIRNKKRKLADKLALTLFS